MKVLCLDISLRVKGDP